MTRTGRLGFVHGTLALFMLAILGQAAHVQLFEGSRWKARAQFQHLTDEKVPAPRGDIFDETGRVLAQTRPMVRLAVAPRELHDPARVVASLAKAGVPKFFLDRIRDTSRVWVEIPGHFVTVNIGGALADAGVHSTPVADRSYALSVGSGGIVGNVDANNHALSGIELAMDELLSGTNGSRQLERDAHLHTFESPSTVDTVAVNGHSVTLTINLELQEIVESALANAVTKLGAEGGDIVIMNPHNGEILALASYHAGAPAVTPSALTDPFEPGSTMKPFIAAALLDRGLATEADTVDVGKGELELKGRKNPIHDDHLGLGRIPLADVIRWSSNVGIVKFASRLSPGAEFESLRDFGFGTATGVVFPSESSGRLEAPARWSSQSASQMAMGYELMVTPLQLATAYATFANGGELLEPSLIKEVRDPDGTVIYHHEPRVVRHPISAETAERVRQMLLGVVDSGTAIKADLSTYLMAGKTGTPYGTVHGRYVAGHYNPNFVGLFPGDNPQYVIVVKLTNPQTDHYGGNTAAPLTKVVIEAAIAARDAALDRVKLASSARTPTESAHVAVQATALAPPSAPSQSGAAVASAAEPGAPVGPAMTQLAPITNPESSTIARAAPSLDPPSKTIVIRLQAPMPIPTLATAPTAPIPDVRGLTLRNAVRVLHNAGFQVQWVSSPSRTTSPAAGELAQTGSLVKLLYDY